MERNRRVLLISVVPLEEAVDVEEMNVNGFKMAETPRMHPEILHQRAGEYHQNLLLEWYDPNAVSGPRRRITSLLHLPRPHCGCALGATGESMAHLLREGLRTEGSNPRGPLHSDGRHRFSYAKKRHYLRKHFL